MSDKQNLNTKEFNIIIDVLIKNDDIKNGFY